MGKVSVLIVGFSFFWLLAPISYSEYGRSGNEELLFIMTSQLYTQSPNILVAIAVCSPSHALGFGFAIRALNAVFAYWETDHPGAVLTVDFRMLDVQHRSAILAHHLLAALHRLEFSATTATVP
jgi:hypothetical protein